MSSKGREVLLFGAGAVIDWGAPKTVDLTKLVRECGFAIRNSDTKITEFIYQRLVDSGYDSKTEINFETIINVIEELLVYYSEFNSKKQTPSLLKVLLNENNLCQIFNYSIEGGKRKHLYKLQIPDGKEYEFSRSSYHNENPNQFFLQHLLSGILTVIHSNVSKYTCNTSGHSVNDKISKNSETFRKWINTKYPQNVLRLYTLNYDNLFKSLLQKDDIECFDGFSDKYIDDNRAPAKIKRIITDFDSPIHYNLHGSSYWNVLSVINYKIQYPVIVKNKYIHLPLSDNVSSFQMEKGKTIFVSNIITGYQKTQKSAMTPFRQMQSAFDKDCILADKITIIGYSFNDEHINESIKIAFKENSILKIEIVDPNFISNKMDETFALNLFPILDDSLHSDTVNKRYSYLKKRIIVYTKYFSDYLKDETHARK